MNKKFRFISQELQDLFMAKCMECAKNPSLENIAELYNEFRPHLGNLWAEMDNSEASNEMMRSIKEAFDMIAKFASEQYGKSLMMPEQIAKLSEIAKVRDRLVFAGNCGADVLQFRQDKQQETRQRRAGTA